MSLSERSASLLESEDPSAPVLLVANYSWFIDLEFTINSESVCDLTMETYMTKLSRNLHPRLLSRPAFHLYDPGSNPTGACTMWVGFSVPIDCVVFLK